MIGRILFILALCSSVGKPLVLGRRVIIAPIVTKRRMHCKFFFLSSSFFFPFSIFVPFRINIFLGTQHDYAHEVINELLIDCYSDNVNETVAFIQIPPTYQLISTQALGNRELKPFEC